MVISPTAHGIISYMVYFNDTDINATVNLLHIREDERLTATLAPTYGIPYINLEETKINSTALKLVSEKNAKRGELVVFEMVVSEHENPTLSVAVKNPKRPETLEVLELIRQEGYTTNLFLATKHSLEVAWIHYQDVETAAADVRGVLEVNEEMIVELMGTIHSHFDIENALVKLQSENHLERTTKILEILFGGALALNASDIHIEPEAISTRVRNRLDGVLMDVGTIDRGATQQVVSRLKLLAGLKLNTRNASQDGRFTFDIGSREVEVRTSVIPSAFGESIVMRLLDPSSAHFHIESLGMNPRLAEVIGIELKRPNGAIITTGPTGSGKTTALYSFLKAVHKPDVKIITIEDPVEYKIPGISQVPVTATQTFAFSLRSILRQDPDVILVGEIRDREVAETAIHASLTGHLVFSTLHTNSAVGAFPRLIDIGVDARMIGSALNIVLGQRLVRVLCDTCKVERDLTTAELTVIQKTLEKPVAIQTVFGPKGCPACGMNGYKGRIGVFEAIIVDEAVENAVIMDPREINILEAAKPQNIPNMQQDGIFKALAGTTSLDELSRVLGLYF